MAKRVALVTGGGSGIGKATAELLAKEGYCVGVLGRTEEDLVEAVWGIEQAGGTAVALVADTAEAQETSDAVEKLVDLYGGLGVVVANAGINGAWAPIDDLTLDEWNQTISVNLTGTFLTLKAVVPHLKKFGGGSVIVVSSINGTRTFTTPGATAYTATKAAQVAMVQQLALELARHHIRINAVCPGEISTEINANTKMRAEDETAIPVIWPEGQVPITGGHPGNSQDVAELIAFLASDRSRHITGTPIWIDGGQGLLR